MRIKSYGLFFEYKGSEEINHLNVDIVKNINNNLYDFILINYFKFEKFNKAYNQDGFFNIEKQMIIELFMIDLNPRKYLFDRDDNKIYRVINTPITQAYNPTKRKRYQLPIELINDNDMRFDLKFIQNKFNELFGVLHADI